MQEDAVAQRRGRVATKQHGKETGEGIVTPRANRLFGNSGLFVLRAQNAVYRIRRTV
jgi:hypothetical protein